MNKNNDTAMFNTDETSDGSCQINYPKITFCTDGITVGSYQTFIGELRRELKGGVSKDFAHLKKLSDVTDENKFIEVELFFTDAKLNKMITITLAIYVVNLYVIGFKTGDNSFFFVEAPPGSSDLLFDETEKKDLKLSTNYNKLPRREEIPLSTGSLNKAIRTLHDYVARVDYKTIERSIVVIIQMVAEATRFKFIEDYIDREFNTEDGYTPGADTCGYENKWSDLSKEILLSENGKFQEPVIVNGEIISNVSQVKSKIVLLLYKLTNAAEGEGEKED